MNISYARRKAIYDAHRKGLSIESLILITGFSRSTVDNVINTMSKRCSEADRKEAFFESWNRTVNSLRSITR